MASSDATTPEGAQEGAVTRERIKDAATLMFVARGFDAVPMSQVAEAAGVTTPAVYWHFKSKVDLYFEVIERSYRTFYEDLVEHTVGGTATEKVHSYVVRFVEEQLRDREATMLFGLGQLGARLPEEKQKEFLDLQHPYAVFLGGLLEEGRDAGEFAYEDGSVTALAIHTMCEYSAVWFRPDRRLSAAEVAKLHADLVVRMLAAGEGDDERP